MAAIFGDFRKYFAKNGKDCKFASISCNRVEIERFRQNRSILHRVSKEIEANLCFAIFGKNFRKSPKMAAIFGDFRKYFAKNGKTLHLLLYPVTVRDRAISAKSLYLARLRSI